jgi:tight adherence protein C
MNDLLEFLRGYLGNGASTTTVFVLLVAGAIFLLTLGTSAIVLAFVDPVRRRMKRLAPHERKDLGRAETIATILRPLSAYIMPKDDWRKSQLGRQLVHAGLRSPNAGIIFYGCKALLMVLLPAVVFVTARWMPDLKSGMVVFYAVASAFLGSLVPSMVLDRLVLRRKRAVRIAFPDALDLMVVCVEAGLGLAAAIQRVADELVVSHPELGTELNLVNAEIRAGVDRPTALRNLADRTGLEDIRGLVALLVQTMRFGTSVADALRVYSEEFRDKRMQAAEEQAAKIGTKMIFPLVLCLFPSFFLVAIGPAVLRLMDVFGQMNVG